jgi:hypothetical protein
MAHSLRFFDSYGHDVVAPGTALAAGAVSTTAAGTIAPTTAAGAAPTVTSVTATDMGGKFTLSPVTGGGAQAAGAVVLVTPTNSWPAVPRAVLCTIYDDANAAAVAASVTSLTASSFNISVGVALTTAHTYTVQFVVVM